MISITNLSKEYSGRRILELQNLEIPPGQSLGLVGNNGAGKTSLFSIFLDLVEPTTGTVFNKEINVREDESWKSFTTSYLDDSFLIDYLTPEEYFNFIGDLRGMSEQEVQVFLTRFKSFFNAEVLGKRKYLRDFSKGNRKKIGVAAAFFGSPDVMVLDEPFANLDPRSQVALKGLLLELSENNQANLLISSHDLRHLTQVCQRIILLHKGQIIKDCMVTPEILEELNAFFGSECSIGVAH